MTVLDYLRPRLFEPLGIAKPAWEASTQGITAGGYGLSVRTTELIPGQILALKTLLAQVGESTVATVILPDDRQGTYIPKPTPKPSATP